MPITTTALGRSYLHEDELPLMLLRLERYVGVPYADSKAIATIGIGIALQNRNRTQVHQGNLALVLRKLGVFAASDQGAPAGETVTQRRERYRAIVSGFGGVIQRNLLDLPVSGQPPGGSQREIALLAALNTELAKYVPTRTFRLTDSEATQVKIEFVQGYEIGPFRDDGAEKNLDRLLGGLLAPGGQPVPHDTREYKALMSLYFNAPTLIGPKLQATLASGDRAEAWYEIRYNSNREQVPGLAKRRYYEAEVFGLYRSGTTAANIVDDEARSIYRMYTLHHPRILDYENRFAAQAQRANQDYALVGDSVVRSLQGSLDWAGQFLISNNARPIGFSGEVNVLDVFVGQDATPAVLSGSVRSDLILGGARNDVLNGLGGDDVIHGGDGDDNLIVGSGSSYLNGGPGRDSFFIYDNGSGSHRILDLDPTAGERAHVILAGQVVPLFGLFRRQGTSNTWVSPDGRTTVTTNSPATVSVTGGASVVIDNFAPGDFGIQLLGPAPDPQVTVIGTTGDDIGLFGGSQTDDLIRGGAGNDQIAPTSSTDSRMRGLSQDGEDFLYGEAGNDIASGGDETDYVDGGDGEDVLAGGWGMDILIGGDGRDILLADGVAASGAANWSVQFLSDRTVFNNIDVQYVISTTDGNGAPLPVQPHGPDHLSGGAGDDRLWGGEGDEYLDGGTENDWLHGFSESDVLLGGEGDDLIWGDSTQNPAQPSWVYTLPQYHGEDYADGGPGDDVITGDGGADVLFGGAGADTLIGDESNLAETWHGADYLDGGEGADTIYGYGKSDTIFGGAGADNLYGDSDTTPWDKHAADYLDGGEGDDVISGDGGADTLLGGAGGDRLFGDADNVPVAYHGADYLDGGDGADILRGYAGDDTLLGGAGNDELLGEAGDDVLDGGPGADRLIGGPGNDVYVADAADVIIDDQGQNTVELSAELGLDALSAKLVFIDGVRSVALASADHDILIVPVGGPIDLYTLNFADGTSLQNAEAFAMLLTEGVVLYGTPGDDTLAGYGGDDLIYGDAGADTLYGFGGGDVLEGGDGDDTLAGGAGDDELRGGYGRDTYRFGLGDGHDTVLDQGDFGEPDTLALGPDLAPEDVEILRRANGDLFVRLRASGESVLLPGWYEPYPANRVERIVFADASELGEAELEALPVAPLLGTVAADTLTGTGLDETLAGLAGDDVLNGAGGDDLLQGGSGLDTYLLAWGMGADRVEEAGGEGGAIRLAPGLDFGQLALERAGSDLFVRIRGTQEGLALAGYFDAPADWTVRNPNGSARALGELLAADPLEPLARLREEFLGAVRAEFMATYAAFGFAPSGPDTVQQPFLPDLFTDVDNVTTVSITFLGLSGERLSGPRFTAGLSLPSGPYLRFAEERLEFNRVETDEASYRLEAIPATFVETVVGAAHAVKIRTESIFLGSRSDAVTLDPPLETSAGTFYFSLTEQVFELRTTTYGIVDGTGADTTGDALVHGRITHFAEVVGGAGGNEVSDARFVDGGAGEDTLRAAGWSIASEAPLGSAEVRGNGAFLYGNAGADRLRGGLASDLLIGGAGDDLANGGDGADGYYLFAGEAGWDLLWDSGRLDPEWGGAQNWFRNWYANRYGTDAPELPADDPLAIESGAVKADTVFFGPGIELAGLTVRRIELAEAELFDGFPAGPREALEVSWAAGEGVRVILPDPDQGEFGEGIERFRFADGTTRTLTEMLALAGADNRPPVLAEPIADRSTDEDAPFAFALPPGTFADPDAGDALSLAASLEDGSPLPGWLAFDPATDVFAGTPGNAEVGSYAIRVSATDPSNESVSDVFTLTVANTNDAPTLANPPSDQSATEDTSFSVPFLSTVFADVDPGDSLAWSAVLATGAPLPAWLAFDPLTRTLSGTPGNGEVGSHRIRLVATDLAGTQAAAELTLAVANVNDAPALANALADRTTEERSPFAWTVPGSTFVDVDPGEVLAYVATLVTGAPLPAWLGFDPLTRTLAGTPGEYDVASFAIRITATDSAGASAADELTLAVTPKPGQTLTGTSSANTITGTDGADTIRAGVGADTVYGNEGQDALYGEDGNDKLYGASGHDVLDGGSGADQLFGDDGDDRLFGGEGNDDLWGGTGKDELRGGDNADLLRGDGGEDLLYGEAGNDELYGGADRDTLNGGANADRLEGNDGADLLQGEAGNDDLLGGGGNDLLDPGANSDVADGGEGSDFITAGTGHDTLVTGTGADVLAYNRGDGQDTVRSSGPQAKTVSLGGGITYTDLSLEKSGIDLLLNVGGNEKLILDDWYAAPANQGFLTLQVIAEAMAGYNPASADPLLSKKVQTFDFAALVGAFDAARAADPMITRWALMDQLLTAHLAASDTAALGGDLAYQYGKAGTLAGMSTTAAQDVLGSTQFGTQAQALRPLATLQEGPVKLT